MSSPSMPPRRRVIPFANITLMGAPITHFFGYFGVLSPFTVLGGLALFFLSAVAGDYFRARRVHPLTAALAILLFLCLPIQAIIGDSASWHHFAAWLARYPCSPAWFMTALTIVI